MAFLTNFIMQESLESNSKCHYNFNALHLCMSNIMYPFNSIYKSHLNILPNDFETHPIHHVFVFNPNCNTISKYTNGGISRVNVGVRSREQWGSVSVVSI